MQLSSINFDNDSSKISPMVMFDYLSFSTKAGTLEALKPVLTKAKLLPQCYFTVNEYEKEPDEVANQIISMFSQKIIIRSSTLTEDKQYSSNAGCYVSIANVNSQSKTDIHQAIQQVIDSYPNSEKNDQLLIQPMLGKIALAGVGFSCCIDTHAPYYIINYDCSGVYDSVTSGSGKNLKTIICLKSKIKYYPDTCLKKAMSLIQELEQLFNNRAIDIEFAITKDDELYLLQVRQLCTKPKESLSLSSLEQVLKKTFNKIKDSQRSHYDLKSDTTYFGVMPDWNPAEIIGVKPKPLALSLYKELITDKIWAYQRRDYGYRDVSSHPLLISILGIPYIDVRVDFNSFIPASLDEELAEKIVSFYLNKLKENTAYHDKIEFEVVHSCLYLNAEKKIFADFSSTLSKQELDFFVKSLRSVTEKIICPDLGRYKQDLKKIKILKSKYKKIQNSTLSDIDKIYWLIEDCKRLGTLPFAGIARAAFIAMQFLNSFVELDIITPTEKSHYLNSLCTISKKLKNDCIAIHKGNLSKDKFLCDYGHLRPGTYDILSNRYDDAFDSYFVGKFDLSQNLETDFEFSRSHKSLINKHLENTQLKFTSDQLLTFIKESIEGREYAKHEFTRSVSQVLSIIDKLGDNFNISREELSFLDATTILKQYSALKSDNLDVILRDDIASNLRNYRFTKQVKLPSLITRPEEVYCFSLSEEEGNFITQKDIEANTINEYSLFSEDCFEKIALIQSADPGYDFLFARGIVGLITQYGGANSHMAIRCAELGIPAAIGIGEQSFGKLTKATRLKIRTLEKLIDFIA